MAGINAVRREVILEQVAGFWLGKNAGTW